MAQVLLFPSVLGVRQGITDLAEALTAAGHSVTTVDHLEGVTVTVKTSDQGKLFGSVSADDIAAAVKKANGRDLDKRTILVNKGEVKTTGSFNVDVKLHPEVTASLNFKVVAE